MFYVYQEYTHSVLTDSVDSSVDGVSPLGRVGSSVGSRWGSWLPELEILFLRIYDVPI